MKTLDIFDFDGTLFRSPTDTKENRDLYEKATGIPWNLNKEDARRLSAQLGRHVGMRRGWFGRAETLEPPLVPQPAPKEMWIDEVVQEFFESKSCKDTATIIMTGRHAGIQGAVLRILHEGGLVDCEIRGGRYYHADADVTCLFRGQDGPAVKAPPKPNDDTISWKLWIIEKYLDFLPSLEVVRIWEDRTEHVAEFSQLNEILPQSVIVKHVQA